MNNFSNSISGQPFSHLTKISVWEKASIVPGCDPGKMRKDPYGYLIMFEDYGNTNSAHGWEIDHIYPISKGGTDVLANLQPLQWQVNRKKGERYPF